MTTARTDATLADAAVETPWYELINDAPEPPEDAMEQASTILYVMSILMGRYKDAPDVLVSEQTNVIYDSNTPGSVVAPDGYVVLGVDAKTIEMHRRSYRVDEWDKPPAFVLEVASGSTAARDLNEKREIYARMGAQEYWRLDWKDLYYGEPLVGERMVDGVYERCELHTEANGDVWARSEALGVDFYYRVEEGVGRYLLRDSVTREWLGSVGEEREARLVERDARLAEREARLVERDARLAEREARLAAEARNEELQVEIERLRGSSE